MKKLKKWTALLAAGSIWATSCFTGVSVLGAAQPGISSEAIQAAAENKTAETRKGWYTLKDGVKQRYYKKNGEYLVGLHKIKDKVYYFNKSGILQKNVWITRNGQNFYDGADSTKGAIYYFGADGARYQGLKKINKKYYYFNKYGIMQTGTVVDGQMTYYLKSNGVLEAKKKGSTVYYANGKAMGKTAGYEYETLQRAKKIVADNTTPSMSDAQKLEKCFRWVMAKYYAIPRTFLKQEGWPALYANDHFIQGRGNCFSDACAFAYLAKALGYKNIYVCVDTDKINNNGHCWAEINGLVYDPLFAQAKNFSRNYASSYRVYGLYPILKQKV